MSLVKNMHHDNVTVLRIKFMHNCKMKERLNLMRVLFHYVVQPEP